jgi:hypothetical protein
MKTLAECCPLAMVILSNSVKLNEESNTVFLHLTTDVT